MQKNDLNNNLPEVEDSINLNKTHDAANKVDLTGHTPKEIDGITYKSNTLSDAIDNVHDAKEKLKAYNANGLKGMRNNHRIKKGKEELDLKYKPDLADRNRESFLRAKGLKNKGKYAIREGAEALKHSKAVKFIQKAINTAKKIIKTVKTLGYPFFISVAVVVLLFNGIIFVYSISQAVGTSPHYYCDIEPDNNTKKDAKYLQYCNSKHSIGLELEELNGHYVTQDGSGPCWAAASLDLLIRYYTKNGVNIYDYLWDSNGLIDKKILKNNTEMDISWSCIQQGGDPGMGTISSFGSSWYNAHGKVSDGSSSWCYICNEDVYEEYENLSNSDAWVYDMNLGQASDTSDCNVLQAGNVIEIEGVKATIGEYTFHGPACSEEQKQELIDLLEDHPSGVSIYTFKNDGDKEAPNHGWLVTRYDADKDMFYIIDPAGGKSGGFEVLADPSNIMGAWDISVKCTAQVQPGSRFLSCVYIEEDKE